MHNSRGDTYDHRSQMNKNILIVDDDIMMSTQLQYACEDFGPVRTASTGFQAIQICNRHRPDIMFIDIHLPDMTGFELIDYLKKNHLYNNAKTLIITADADEKNHIASVGAGASVFLSKPVSNGTIKEYIRTILSSETSVPSVSYIAKSQKRIDQVFDMLSDVVIISDERGTIKALNQRCLTLFGYKEQELIDQNIKVLIPSKCQDEHDNYIVEYHYNNYAKLSDETKRLVAPTNFVEATTQLGKDISLEFVVSEFLDGQQLRYITVIRDVTEKIMLQKEIIKASIYDNLTGLKTTNALNTAIETIKHRADHDTHIFATLIDIDDFHSVNVFHGYDMGNRILLKLSTKLKQLAQNNGAEAYRVAGDHFIILSSHRDEQASVNQKVDFIDKLKLSYIDLKESLAIPISFTSICMVRATFELETHNLVNLLEMSLISAKHEGRSGKISRASSIGIDYAIEHNKLHMNLKSGVNSYYLDIAIQPKVNCHNQITSCEALLRWRHPSFKLLSLIDFISIAESSGAISEVGNYVLQRVCMFLSELESDKRVRIFINLSIRQLADKSLISTILNYCKEYDISHSLIGFELTESMISQDIERIRLKLTELENLGFEIAVDDFGTGQSNLKYIHQLPIHSIKIDKSFIDDITGEAESYPIVDAIIAMANKMDRTIVAEGVEIEAQANYLWGKGIEEIQGYFYHKPMPTHELLKLLSN